MLVVKHCCRGSFPPTVGVVMKLGSVQLDSKSTEVVVRKLCNPTVEVVVTSEQGPTPSVVRTLPDPLGGQKSPPSTS